MQQDDRPLGQHPETNRQPQQGDATQGRAFSGFQGAMHADQGEEGKNHVEHRCGGKNRPQRTAHQNQRRRAADAVALRPEPARQSHRQKHTGRRKQGRNQPRPPFIDTKNGPTGLIHPDHQRRLVAVGCPVLERHQKIAAQPHLPGHADVARLVDWRHRPRNKSDAGQQSQHEQGQQHHAALRVRH